MNSISIFYYTTDSGKCQVREFIDSLNPKSQRKFFFACGLLEEFGRKLPEPHAKYIGEGIFELRFGGLEGSIRILYFFFERDKAIFTNGFIKKTNKLPKKEQRLAQMRRKNYLGLGD